MDLLSKRALNRGFGTAQSSAFEFAASIAVFFGLGWLLDRWLGTTPVFMIGCFVFAMVGLMIKQWLAYDRRMRQHEADLRSSHGASAPVLAEQDAA